MDQQTRRQAGSTPQQKKSYRSPRVTEYGSIRELTCAGPSGFEDTATSRYAFFFMPEDDTS